MFLPYLVIPSYLVILFWINNNQQTSGESAALLLSIKGERNRWNCAEWIYKIYQYMISAKGNRTDNPNGQSRDTCING